MLINTCRCGNRTIDDLGILPQLARPADHPVVPYCKAQLVELSRKRPWAVAIANFL